MRSHRLNWRGSLGILLLGLLAIGAASHRPVLAQPAGTSTIKVGLIAPLTGGSADFGNSVRFGAEIAVKEINAVAGVLGRPIELIIKDDKALPAEGRRVSEELVIKDKADFTIGFCNTGVAMQSLEVFQKNQHLLMVPCSQGTAVTQKYPPANSFIFRVAPVDWMNAKFLIDEIVDNRHFKRVAILADNTGYGDGGLNDLSSELAKRGLKPAYVGRFDLGVTSLTVPLQEARAAGAQALVVYTVGPEQATAVKSRAALGWTVPYYAPWPLSFQSVLDLAGPKALEGTMMVQSIIQDLSSTRRTAFLSSYFKHTGQKRIGSLMAAAQAYDSVYLMVWALFQTRGDTRGPALKEALENLDRSVSGVVTTYKNPFSATDHDAFAPNMIWLGVWRNGEIDFQYPDDARKTGFIRRKASP